MQRLKTYFIGYDRFGLELFCKGYAIYQIKDNLDEFLCNETTLRLADSTARQSRGTITKIITDEFGNEMYREQIRDYKRN